MISMHAVKKSILQLNSNHFHIIMIDTIVNCVIIILFLFLQASHMKKSRVVVLYTPKRNNVFLDDI